MSQQELFLKILREDPYDLVTHRVYGDWLEDHGFDDEAEFHHEWTAEWQRAWDWVRDFCRRVDVKHSYFLEVARRHLADGEEIAVGLNTSNLTVDEDMGALWANVATVLRLSLDGYDADPFSCSDVCFPDGLNWDDEEILPPF